MHVMRESERASGRGGLPLGVLLRVVSNFGLEILGPPVTKQFDLTTGEAPPDLGTCQYVVPEIQLKTGWMHPEYCTVKNSIV